MAAPDLSFSPDFAGSKQYAVMYRQCGIQVVPARYPMVTREDKRPALAGWKEFQDGLINDGLFETWFPQATTKPNMGLITGRASGNIFVVDLDEHSHEAARLWWQGLLQIENYGQELETWSQVTGGGGRQLFFRAPPDWHAPTNRTPIGVDIRGQGGFAMLPPSLHLSGKEYEWAPGCAPYEIEVLDAPQWLLDAVDRLVEQYGGDNGSNSGGERTPSPATDFDAFGARVDGREDALAKWVWGAVVGLYRDTNGVYPADHGAEAFQASLEAWLRHARTRLAGVSNAEGLERECRGPSAFRAKWERAVKKWHGRVAEDAARPRPGAEAPPVTEIPAAALQLTPSNDFDDKGMATPFEWIDPTSIPPRAWVYGRHYIRKFVSTTVAPGGVGKTALGVVEALAIVSGKPLLDVLPEEQANVWLWNGEDPMEEMQRRVMAAAVHYGMAPSDVAGRLFVDTGRVTPIVIAEKTKDGATINVPIVERVVHTITANRIGVMVIDPFVACHRVTENDNSEIERVAKTWAQIADATNCSIELVHHVRKTNGNEVSVEDGRGATALLAAARSARALNRMTAEEATKAAVTEPGLYFRTDNGKANLAPPSSVATWYHLASLDLDNDVPMSADGPARPSDKVGVVTRWEWPDPTADVTASDMHAVRAKVSAGQYREDPQAKDWVGHAIGEVVGFEMDDAGRAKAKALQAMWTRSGALKVIDGMDERRRPKKFVVAGDFNEG